MPNRKYTLNGKVVAVNRHKAIEQKNTDSLEEYIAAGGKTDRLTVKEHRKIYKRLDRWMPGSLLAADGTPRVMYASKGLHNGKPDYYNFTDGAKATPARCRFLKSNQGLIFVSKIVS